jgi:hypothetical protein
MKAPRPPQRETDVVDEIVEDLSQQDVLPASAQTESMPSRDGDMVAEEQAGNWDEPAGGVGHQAPRTPLEDECKASEALVERGVTEAGEELRELEEEESLPDEAA